MGRFNRNKAKEELLKRTQESSERREGDASMRYFRSDLDLPLWGAKPTKEDPHIIDIIPFIAGENYPTKIDKRHAIKKGDYVYLLELYVHTNIGPGKEWIVCPTKNYGNPCPICEEISRRVKEGQEWEEYKDISPKRRCVYNIVCYDNAKEEQKGVQIWEVSYKYGEGPIQLQAKNPRGGGAIPFSDVDVGKSISFEVANDEYRTIQGHKLLDRDYIISDEILDQTFSLDETIVLLSYEQISKIFFVGSTDKETKKEEVAQNPDTSSNVTVGRRERRTEQPQDSPEVDPNNPCPFGGKFGQDIDQLVSCGECKKYTDCANRADEIDKELKATKSSGNTRTRTRG